MSQKKKNTTLLVILALLVISSIVLGLLDNTKNSYIEDKNFFSVQDTSKVDLISIKSKDGSILLKKTKNIWTINEKYKSDKNMMRVLLSILKDVEILRIVPKTQQKEVAQNMLDNGFLVDIYNGDNIIRSFYAAGNSNKTMSYMMSSDDHEPMIMSLPGYESYIAGIFEIPKNDWRDRTILSTNWRTLQNLKVNYTEFPEYNLHIKFDFNFLAIEGVSSLDTAKMMAYIGEFNFLQADRFIDNGQIPQYDSLLQTPPTVTMTIEDIDSKNSKSIAFFPMIKNDRMMVALVKEDKQMALFEATRIQNLFAVKSDFEAKPKDGHK